MADLYQEHLTWRLISCGVVTTIAPSIPAPDRYCVIDKCSSLVPVNNVGDNKSIMDEDSVSDPEFFNEVGNPG
jgi:hypothetical protein